MKFKKENKGTKRWIWLLLAICIGGTGFFLKKATSAREAESSGKIVIRFAHWRLEKPTLKAFDLIAEEYMRLHPGVRVEQIAVPLRIVRAWQQTQLVSNEPPDLIMLNLGLTDETVGKQFVPLGRWVEAPNPYNAGNELSHTNWGETFVRGLTEPPFLNRQQMEVYSVPAYFGTFRILYNKRLLEEVTEKETPPETFDEFRDFIEKVNSREAQNSTLVPVSATFDRAFFLLELLAQTQTQVLSESLDYNGDGIVDLIDEAGRAYFNRRWALDGPEVKRSTEIMELMAKGLQRGFMSHELADAIYLFSRETAVALAVSSIDITNIAAVVGFPTVAGPIPTPDSSTRYFGDFVRGPQLEPIVRQGFGITRKSKHVDVARDFLQFMTSKNGNQLFHDVSGNTPTVTGVSVRTDLQAFIPVTKGFPPGFSVGTITSLQPGSGLDLHRLSMVSYQVLQDEAGAHRYLAEVRQGFDIALRSDMQRSLASGRDMIRRTDAVAAGLKRQKGAAGPARYQAILQAQDEQELMNLKMQQSLSAGSSKQTK